MDATELWTQRKNPFLKCRVSKYPGLVSKTLVFVYGTRSRSVILSELMFSIDALMYDSLTTVRFCASLVRVYGYDIANTEVGSPKLHVLANDMCSEGDSFMFRQ